MKLVLVFALCELEYLEFFSLKKISSSQFISASSISNQTPRREEEKNNRINRTQK
jgi:hypothetical protein